MIPATDSKVEILKKILCWLIINKPLRNLYSGDTSILAVGHNYRGSTVVMFQ